jgi:hypothetical protein
MHIQVKYGLITLINQERDLCETIEKADLECPLKKGEMSMTKDVDLPNEIPPVCRVPTLKLRSWELTCTQGTYTVIADVYTESGKKITCLTAKVAFHR